MATSPRNLVSLAIAFALAVPALAAAQRTASSSSSSTSSGEVAVPRTDPPASSGAGSGGGSSSSERSVGSSSTGSSQVMVPEIPTFRSSYSSSSSSSGQRTAPPGSSTGSTASPRGSSGSSGSSGGGSSSSSGGSSGSGAGSSATPRGNDSGISFGRSRDGRPSAGVATPRETIDINGLSFPIYGPSFARWYPFGSTGFGWNYGFVNYDPWFYSRSPWIWGWNGLWYDPYDPYGYNSWYGYNPYGYGYPYSSSYGRSSKTSDENDRVGSIRLRVNPSEAQVYVDGALMGVVDDFDGFSDHLKLAGGTHTIELKADGYEPYSGKVTVSVGKTVTERVSLKKKK